MGAEFWVAIAFAVFVGLLLYMKVPKLIADAVVVAARARKTPSRALAAAISQLEIAGAHMLGVALNRVDIRKGKRSFYDGLYYSKSFSGYYTREAS